MELLVIISAPFRQRGAHIQFARTYMKMSQPLLAEKLGLGSHASVSKWEKKDQNPTGMLPPVEFVFRMIMAKYSGKEAQIQAMFEEVTAGLSPPDEPLAIPA